MEGYLEKLIGVKAGFINSEWALSDWTDKVMDLLFESEICINGTNKYPKVRGLRRIGSFILNSPTVRTKSEHCSEHYAASHASLWSFAQDKATGGLISVEIASAMAEANPQNVHNHPLISQHLLATAESRAEGRLWAKALYLNCLTAEELSLDTNKPVDSIADIDDSTNKAMQSVQMKGINKLCKKLDLNPLKLAEMVSVKNGLQFDGKVVSFDLAAKTLHALDEINRNESIEIPETVKGFVKLED